MPLKRKGTGVKPVLFFADGTVAWLGALCFLLSTVEFMIPKPLPFLRLGLANLPVMLAIDVLPFPSWLLLLCIKILGQGLVSGTLFSYICLFSAVGTLASAFAMLALKRLFRERVSFIGLSAAGAFASNGAQLALARYWIFGEGALYIAPPFLAVGLATGTLLGAFANAFAAKSLWYSELRIGALSVPAPQTASDESSPSAGKANQGLFPSTPTLRFGLGFPLLAALLFADSLAVRAIAAAVGLALLLSDSAKIRLAPTLTVPAGIVLFSLLVPFGKVLASPLGFPITEGALLLGIKKALSIEGMVFISRWMLRSGLRLPGRAGKILADSLAILKALTERRKDFKANDPIGSIDRLMRGPD